MHNLHLMWVLLLVPVYSLGKQVYISYPDLRRIITKHAHSTMSLTSLIAAVCSGKNLEAEDTNLHVRTFTLVSVRTRMYLNLNLNATLNPSASFTAFVFDSVVRFCIARRIF